MLYRTLTFWQWCSRMDFFRNTSNSFQGTQVGKCRLQRRSVVSAHLSSSYDRFFSETRTPCQRTGQSVALPLQGMAQREGNCVFVDEDFNAYADQWEMLSQIHKLSEVDLICYYSCMQCQRGRLLKDLGGETLGDSSYECCAI